ncbi:MAG: hypothetical protein WHV26_14970 [Spirochaetota bacterium]
MIFETTTCISLKHLDILSMYAQKYNLSLHTFIFYLVNYAAKHEKRRYQAFVPVAYRKRKKIKDWKRVHLYVYHSEYELYLDVKKLWKMSLARIIEFCVDKVLIEFIQYLERKLKNTDNYLDYYFSRSYTFHFYRENGIHCCQYHWGPPPEVLHQNTK